MNRKECRNTRREIDELEIGQQPGEQASAHLAVCPTCRGFCDERADLRQLVASLEPVVAPADFDMRLRARIAGERKTNPRQPFFARLIGMPAIAAAALVVLVVGSIVWVAQRKGDQSSTVATKDSTVNPGAGQVVAQSDTKPLAKKDTTEPKRVDDVVADGGERLSAPGKGRLPVHASTRDFNLREARSIRQGDADEAFVNAPSKPVVVSFQNEQGTTRKISLPPVSFGAQSLVDNRVANYSPNSRIW